jgi:hypothetical protein
VSEHDPRAWKAVGEAVKAQRGALDQMTQKELHVAARVGISVISELENGVIIRDRAPGTLARLSEALRWPENYLDDILNGHATPGSAAPEQAVGDSTSSEESLRSIGEKLDNVNGKLDALLKHYDIVWEPGQPSGIGFELEGDGHSHEPPKLEDDGPASMTDG